MDTCSIKGCDKPAWCRTWCRMHYNRNYRHGSPMAKKKTGWKGGQQAWNPGGNRTPQRVYKLRRHGLTEETFAALLEAQGGGCAICGSTEPGNGSFRIDHDHDTGQVRGLLCHKCNVALGLMGDDPERLARAAAYLREARCESTSWGAKNTSSIT